VLLPGKRFPVVLGIEENGVEELPENGVMELLGIEENGVPPKPDVGVKGETPALLPVILEVGLVPPAENGLPKLLPPNGLVAG